MIYFKDLFKMVSYQRFNDPESLQMVKYLSKYWLLKSGVAFWSSLIGAECQN